MSDTRPIAGDEATVSVLVAVAPAAAFRIFTEEIDQWWRSGRKYRIGGKRRSIIHIEPGMGGRLFESVETSVGTKVYETGRVTDWTPPTRLVFEWRAVNLAASAHRRGADESVSTQCPRRPASLAASQGMGGAGAPLTQSNLNNTFGPVEITDRSWRITLQRCTDSLEVLARK